MQEHVFNFHTGAETIAGDMLGDGTALQALFLHGAGHSNRQRQRPLREYLSAAGMQSVAIDFSGHGDSTALTPNSLSKRLDEAQQATGFLTAGPHTVIGSSMSGEIAIRLACTPGNHIGHLVLLVGAIYDRAAFSLPFGPRFSAVIRQPQSWRNALTLDLIATYAGDFTIIRARDDAVIPHEIADLLVARATAARSRRIVDLEGCDHKVSERLRDDPHLLQQVAAAIRTPARQ
ncbi:alpha/beta hydrolase [Herbaspirillum autotrophicum]|uniref:alpha/beta hydrolase n=1 Tax=Herbaspirillum autotrophicum TaxID=180195 RepID=UPI00067D6821|nr:alpha/beta fold hydrolase [Herbaspirillum autotrophicum]